MNKPLMIASVTLLGLLAGGYAALQSPQFGALPTGERLQRIQKSPHYQDKQFVNFTATPQFTGNSRFDMYKRLFFDHPAHLAPKNPIPFVKTDLKNLDKSKNQFIWFGHSAYLLVLDGTTYLIDPSLVQASPVDLIGKALPGSQWYQPESMPAVDYLIITHDHYDHLDYATVRAIKDRVGAVITTLGTGAHFERWGYRQPIIELDWYEQATLANATITALPTRHFAGRGLHPNQALWASFMLQTPSKTIYIGGDGGYDSFFKDIGKHFAIDLAILENGQYNSDWANIHTLPAQLPQILQDLHPQKFVTVHNSKYILSTHPWYEPMDKIFTHAQQNHLPLYTPMIGEIFDLDNDRPEDFRPWWQGVE